MASRKFWSVALSVMLMGSATTVWGAETPPPKSESEKLAAAPESQPPGKPKELSDAAKKGLAYLVSQQHENGGFGQGGGWRLKDAGGSGRVEGDKVKDPPDVGNTCIAALALTRAGNTPKSGPYAKQLAKAIEFIEQHIEEADTASLYVTPVRDTQLQSKIGRYVDTFLAALVLSELKGKMPDQKSEQRLVAALNKTIGKIETNQQADGTFAGNAGWASVLSQGLCSKALNRAFQNGVAVKSETIKRDLDQSVAQLAPDATALAASAAASGPVSAAKPSDVSRPSKRPAKTVSATGTSATGGKGDAGVSLYSLSSNAGRVQDAANSNKLRADKAKKVLANPVADDQAKDAAKKELQEVAEADKFNVEAAKQISSQIGDERFLRGFGNNGGEEFLSYMNISETMFAQGGEAWTKWDRQTCETISKTQNEDGSWSGHHCITGRTFCTSAALLTMMADRAPLPVADVNAPVKGK